MFYKFDIGKSRIKFINEFVEKWFIVCFNLIPKYSIHLQQMSMCVLSRQVFRAIMNKSFEFAEKLMEKSES